MKLTQVTAEFIKTNDAGDYNISEWKKRVASYENLNATFYQGNEKKYSSDVFYAVYLSDDGIRFIQEISFSCCLSSQPLQMLTLCEDGTLFDNAHCFPKTKQGRKAMKQLTELSKSVVFQ